MATYRVVVTYTVDVVDQDAVLRAGADAWKASAEGWAVRVQNDGGVTAATAEEAAAVVPGVEAGIAFVVGAQPYPSVPGVQVTGSGVDVVPT